jgi:hypothetical protein
MMYSITSITADKAVAIEECTRGQTTNRSWLQERCYRLHASHFGRICKATVRTDFIKLAVSLTAIHDFISNATDHGKKYEEPAIGKYCELQSVSVVRSGIVVCMEKPYLACSPDGLVGDDLLVEVKCPYTVRNMLVTDITVPYLFKNDEGKLCLQPSHDYYYQIQGQMFITKCRLCHLVVYTLVDCCIVDVSYDASFVDAMIQKLDSFFCNTSSLLCWISLFLSHTISIHLHTT